MHMSCMLKGGVAIASVLLALSAYGQTVRLPSSTDVDGLVTLCAGGKSKQLTASIKFGFTEWKKLVGDGKLKANVEDLGAVLARIPVDATESKIYENYTKCVTDQVREFLKVQDPKARLEERYGRLASARLVYLLVRSGQLERYWDTGDTTYFEGAEPYFLPYRPERADDGSLKVEPAGPPLPTCSTVENSLRLNVKFPASAELGKSLMQCWNISRQVEALEELTKSWRSSLSVQKFQGSANDIVLSPLRKCVTERTEIPEKFLARIELDWKVAPPKGKSVPDVLCRFSSAKDLSNIARFCRNEQTCTDCDPITTALLFVRNSKILSGPMISDNKLIDAEISSALTQTNLPKEAINCARNQVRDGWLY